MGLAAARAIAPQLSVAARDPAREMAALEALACGCGRFTPRLALVPPAALLLEIGGCLRLFGGVQNLLDAAGAAIAEQGFGVHSAVAPTPQGALWLAQAAGSSLPSVHPREGLRRARPAPVCRDLPTLGTALDALPLAPLDLPPPTKELLAGFGVRRLRDARRLPPAALARRVGAATVAALARAYGDLPDPRRDFLFPERFAQFIELPAPVDSAAALLFAARRLTAALAGWLAARQAGIQSCRLRLEHRDVPATDVELRFAAITRDGARFERVLRERLERLTLAAPVESLRLEVDAVEALPGASAALFAGAAGDTDGMAALTERLRARLGEAPVHGLACVADHRPECATQSVAQGRAAAGAAAGPRPFWLLATPEAIGEHAGRPWRNGPLRLLAGPERIESGWWDAGETAAAGDARRDYFVALTADARWAWVFRELRAPGGWFLHGWFA